MSQRTLIWTDLKRTDIIWTDIKMNARASIVQLMYVQIRSDKVYKLYYTIDFTLALYRPRGDRA